MENWVIGHVERMRAQRKKDLSYAMAAKAEDRTDDYERAMRSIWYIDQEIMKHRL